MIVELTPQPKPPAPKKSVALDFLRGIAVVLVLFRHAPAYPEFTLGTILTTGGWIGVDIFFVLSGYLVSGLILAEVRAANRFDIRRFLIRRGLKIYPAFYFMIFATAVMSYWRYGHVEISAFAAEIFFVQNYFPGLWGHTWSLGVEEHFYILLAVSIWLILRVGSPVKQSLFWVSLVTLIVCLSMRIALSLSQIAYAHETHLFPTHLRIDALSAGVMLRVFLSDDTAERRMAALATRWRIGIAVSAASLACWPFWNPLGSAPWITSVGFSLLTLSAILAILALRGWSAFESLRAVGLFARLGRHSYSVYLWHLPLAHIASAVGKRVFPEWGGGLSYAAYFAAAVVGGVALGRLIEVPALSFRDRYFPARVAAVVNPNCKLT